MEFWSTMNKTLLVYVLVLISTGVKAQWSAVSTGGNDTVGGYILSSSVGELLVDDAAIPGYRLKFGVQQPLTFPWHGARMKGRVVYASNPNVPLGQVQVLLKQNGTVVGTTTTSQTGDFDLGTRGTGSYALEFVSSATWRGVRRLGGDASLHGGNDLDGDSAPSRECQQPRFGKWSRGFENHPKDGG
jgi:hypothetical protein